MIIQQHWLSFTHPETNLIGHRCTTRKTGSSSPSWRPPQKLSLPTQSSALFLTVHLSLELEDLSVPGECCPLDHATSPYSLSDARHTYSSHVQYFYGRTADGRRTAEWARFTNDSAKERAQRRLDFCCPRTFLLNFRSCARSLPVSACMAD